MKLPDLQFHVGTDAAYYATPAPSAPTTKAPVNTLVCNAGTNTFQCVICGEGQGIGPVLSEVRKCFFYGLF